MKFLLFLLKLIIHTKRFIAAFFVTVLIKPLAWLARIVFDLILVPIYRLYVRVSKKIETPSTSGTNTLTRFINGRFNVHIVIIVVGLTLTINNFIASKTVASYDELVGSTKLSRIISEDSGETDQIIEDYPNLELASLRRRLREDGGILRVATNILTRQQTIPEQSGTPAEARTGSVVYTIQNGDTISTIARRFGVSINTILWENNLRATSVIKPGMQLTILPRSGVTHTIARGQTLGQIAKLYGVTNDEILKANNLSNPNQLAAGAKIIIPGGSQLASATPSRSTSSQVASSLRQIIGDKKPSSVIPSGGRMAWPTSGYRITQYYSYRHTGVDIANRIGTPIYAADSGVVVTVGYNRGGYGNQIIIDHGGGKKTRYAHLASFDVRVGNKVSKGQYIGGMGSTGRSTGPHLHFEVIINGRVYNPLNYVR